MTGNVWQHVSDWYRPDTYREQSRHGVVRNPDGPARMKLSPDSALPNVGFRLAKTP